MNRSLGGILVGIAAVGTIVAGIVHAKYTNRWGITADMIRAGQSVEGIPRQFGDWFSENEDQLSTSVLEMLDCAGYASRTYSDRRSGDTVQMTLLAGPSGPISVHTPEICYPSQQYQVKKEREKKRIRSSVDESSNFWRTQFIGKSERADNLEVWYAWSDGRDWQAPDEPRVTFWDAPVLYKIQVATVSQSGNESEKVVTRFLGELLPVLRQNIQLETTD